MTAKNMKVTQSQRKKTQKKKKSQLRNTPNSAKSPGTDATVPSPVDNSPAVPVTTSTFSTNPFTLSVTGLPVAPQPPSFDPSKLERLQAKKSTTVVKDKINVKKTLARKKAAQSARGSRLDSQFERILREVSPPTVSKEKKPKNLQESISYDTKISTHKEIDHPEGSGMPTPSSTSEGYSSSTSESDVEEKPSTLIAGGKHIAPKSRAYKSLKLENSNPTHGSETETSPFRFESRTPVLGGSVSFNSDATSRTSLSSPEKPTRKSKSTVWTGLLPLSEDLPAGSFGRDPAKIKPESCGKEKTKVTEVSKKLRWSDKLLTMGESNLPTINIRVPSIEDLFKAFQPIVMNDCCLLVGTNVSPEEQFISKDATTNGLRMSDKLLTMGESEWDTFPDRVAEKNPTEVDKKLQADVYRPIAFNRGLIATEDILGAPNSTTIRRVPVPENITSVAKNSQNGAIDSVARNLCSSGKASEKCPEDNIPPSLISSSLSYEDVRISRLYNWLESHQQTMSEQARNPRPDLGYTTFRIPLGSEQLHKHEALAATTEVSTETGHTQKAEKLEDSGSTSLPPRASNWANELTGTFIGTQSMFAFINALELDEFSRTTRAAIATAFLAISNADRGVRQLNPRPARHLTPLAILGNPTALKNSIIYPKVVTVGCVTLARFLDLINFDGKNETDGESVVEAFKVASALDMKMVRDCSNGASKFGRLGRVMGYL
ncbi:hypothetical protein P280DRAFT_479398 [Massarina eburnea CBS 473.64]|uniref:Uncharacterized protein n=1 Tax=Massarina eburnea CBS 473.64 TaxID=1395130 RepID=A0A6A6S6Z3_9PLEO|nr:hypothetical protein P280DRAFT_479398 [Massarina eburnea CBS 473.64]